jgi:hypothetical protein
LGFDKIADELPLSYYLMVHGTVIGDGSDEYQSDENDGEDGVEDGSPEFHGVSLEDEELSF